MRAFVYESDAKLHLRDWPQPSVGPGGAIMRIDVCSICGTDLRTFRHGSNRIDAPRVIGHEVCGELVLVGRNLTGFRLGQRVTVTPAVGCGSCLSCRRGYSNLCEALKTIGFQFDGGFAHYMEVPAVAFERGNVNKVAEKISSEEVIRLPKYLGSVDQLTNLICVRDRPDRRARLTAVYEPEQ